MGVGERWGGRLFEAGHFLTFSAFRMGAYIEVGANLRLGAYLNKYGNSLFFCCIIVHN